MNKIKRYSLIALLFSALFCQTVAAEDVVLGRFCYSLDENTQTASVIYNDTLFYSGDVVIPSSVSYKGASYTVTSIGEKVFKDFSNITTVSLPATLTSIGAYAFSGCSSMKTINIPVGVTKISEYSFADCSSLEDIELPAGLTTIETYAFHCCTSLKSIELPFGVKTLGKWSFAYCINLESIKLPDGITTIGERSFSQCRRLKEIDLPNGITEISPYAFQYCDSLSAVRMSESITSIGRNAFQYCYALVSVQLSKNLTLLSRMAFKNCKSLRSIVFPESLTTVEFNPFCNCTMLTGITFLHPSISALSKLDITWMSASSSVTMYLYDNLLEYAKAKSPWSSYTIRPIITSLALPASMSVERTKSSNLYAAFLPTSATMDELAWSSSDPKIATVSDEGVVTGVALGTTTITATAKDGLGATASCIVTVTDASGIEDITLDDGNTTYYQINGVRLKGKPVHPGVYITDGKKILIK